MKATFSTRYGPAAARHPRRQCAHWARVKTFSEGVVTGACVGAEPLVKLTVSLRTTLSHARRMPQRGQSFQSIGARGSDGGSLMCGRAIRGGGGELSRGGILS